MVSASSRLLCVACQVNDDGGNGRGRLSAGLKYGLFELPIDVGGWLSKKEV